MNTESGILMRLGDSGQMLADQDQDIRGYRVVDRDGVEIGKVDDLIIDHGQRKVRILRVRHGGLFGVGGTSLFLPVETVEHVAEGLVMIGRSRVQVAKAPEYDPDLVDRDERMGALYDYYGYAPFGAPGYLPPARGLFR
ncbi:PRC-barrel domain-containing protein [Actinoplanes sp. G11-F43]|uniref:PRC-barrel domain containing protein n=1 Tax=Actinoplanes sp. G11-F43 TaxID=3424130 RepID=UPI003D32CEB6